MVEPRITKTPDVCGGKACVAGHRIRVIDIVMWYEREGLTPDQIVDYLPTITLSDVHSALAYYYDHIEEIRAEIEDEARVAEELQRTTPSLLQEKLRERKLREAS